MTSKKQYPRISIITPSFNQGDFLEETILSVLEQGYPNLEFMIIDGGSADQSVEIIKKYEPYLAYWISEKDQGQTHAINKGFKRASGELINWLNSDDMIVPGALKKLAQAAFKHPEADVYYGDYKAVDGAGKTLYQRKCAPYHPNTLFWGRQLSSQPAVFFRRDLLTRLGWLNEKQQFCMDTEFWIRIARNGAVFSQVTEPIGITRVHGDAKTTLLQQVLRSEHKQIVEKYKAIPVTNARTRDLYYLFMNRYWRVNAAVRRLLFRKDTTFLNASAALKTISQES